MSEASEKYNGCNGDCESCNARHRERITEAMNKPLAEEVLDMMADYQDRLLAEGVKFTAGGMNAVSMGDVPDTTENRAKVAIGWMRMMLAMDHPKEGEFKSSAVRVLCEHEYDEGESRCMHCGYRKA